jgi:hypothetical protein
MVDIAPEIKMLCAELLSKPPLLQLTPAAAVQELQNAVQYRNLNVCFIRLPKMRICIMFRLDRKPVDDEILPWLQELFEDGQIHEVTPLESVNYREFYQGEELYSEPRSLADTMANGIVDYAELKDDIEFTKKLDK